MNHVLNTGVTIIMEELKDCLRGKDYQIKKKANKINGCIFGKEKSKGQCSSCGKWGHKLADCHNKIVQLIVFLKNEEARLLILQELKKRLSVYLPP
jgi:hypothetical protein